MDSKTETVSDNEAILKFIGAIQDKNGHPVYLLPKSIGCIPAGVYKIRELKFADSWNWMHSLIDKIAEYRLAYPEETAKVCDAKIVVGLTYLYPKVVECIRFINSQSPDTIK